MHALEPIEAHLFAVPAPVARRWQPTVSTPLYDLRNTYFGARLGDARLSAKRLVHSAKEKAESPTAR